MAEAVEIVVLNDDSTFTSAAGCTLIRILDPEVAAGLTAGDYEEPEDLPPLSIERYSIDALMHVATVATGVLDSEGGALTMAELALAVHAAGLGDFTEQYADEIAFLAGEGQRG